MDETSRVSIAVFTTNDNGGEGKPVVNLSPSVSLSRQEVMDIGKQQDAAKIPEIKLASFWNRIGRNQFCLPDGSVVNSNMTLTDYYVAAKPHYPKAVLDLATQEKGRIYTICYKETTRVPNAKKAGDVPLDLTLHTFENKLGDFATLPDAPALDPNAVAQAGLTPGSRPGQMGVGDWNEVLVGNGLLNGFVIDTATQSISKARKTAFKLEPNPVHPLLFSPGTVSSTEVKELQERAKKVTEKSPVSKIESGLQLALAGSSEKPESHKNLSSDDAGNKDDDEKDIASPENPLDHLFPLWEVCDDSRIKIETVSTKLQLASAAQGFSSASVEAAVATSAVSFAADASAGFGTKSSSASSSSTGTKSEQMHATYEFPRVRLYLDEDSISLSNDCADAIHKIEHTKSYQEIQKFYRTYGHLFVTRVKLGGRLRATRFLSANEATTMGATQNAWKASIAASFSSVTTSGSAKASMESGSSSEHKSDSSSVNESICWEAHGGNTTLANNPSAWCNTVENFWYWRVVEQEVILPIEEVISRMEGFEQTRAIFSGIVIDALFQASPTEITWNGAPGMALGSGISAVSIINKPEDLLRRSALKAGQVATVPVSVERPSRWSIINNNRDLYRLLQDTFKQTINSYVGTRLFPNFVWRVGLGDRAFSVVLSLRADMEKSTTTFTVDGKQTTDPTKWRNKYGDFYINSTVSGSTLTVCWTFSSDSSGELLSKARTAVANFFTAPPASFEIGCAYMARLAVEYPCEAYLYDAYYNETKVSSPSNVLSAIAQQKKNVPKQVVSVGLEPYRNLDSLNAVTGVTVSSVVSPSALEAVRNDQVEFVVQSIKRQRSQAIIDSTDSMWTSGTNDFSPAKYSAGQQAPDGGHGAAGDIAKDYNNLFSRASSTTISARITGWPGKYGDLEAFERLLRWLRLSRQQETRILFSEP